MRLGIVLLTVVALLLGGVAEAEAGKRGGGSRASSGRAKSTKVKGHVRHTQKGKGPKWVPGHQRSK